MKEKDLVRVIDPETTVIDELLEEDVVKLLNSVDHVGTITQIKEELIYVTFERGDVRVTQMFQADELEVM